ncbi:hypothetical protein EZY14_002825 [Kordia sp. TARA_039_SRF]|nr:hypothetical protein EZY14_002825 [Kordia sp. TARA_039_SRF]
MEGKLNPNDVSNIYKNINHKPCNVPMYDFAWDVTKDGIFIGELFFIKEFQSWNFILDNFPAPRRSFNTSFPQTEESFESAFKRIGVELVKQSKTNKPVDEHYEIMKRCGFDGK